MKNKVFMALLLAGALALGPISGSLAGFNVSAAEAGSDTASRPAVSAGDISGSNAGEMLDYAAELMGTKDPDSVVAAVFEAIAGEEKTVAEAVTEVMLSDDVSKVADLEAAYVEAQGKYYHVTAKLIDESAGIGINKDEVTIVGAAFNTYDKGDPSEPSYRPSYQAVFIINGLKVAISSEHLQGTLKNYGEKKVLSIGTQGSKEQLTYPVKITMPVPEGMDAAKVAVFHYATPSGHGELEKVDTVTEEGNKISFCLSSINDALLGADSTVNNLFIFAEAKSGDDEKDPTNPSTPDIPVEGGKPVEEIVEEAIEGMTAENADATVTAVLYQMQQAAGTIEIKDAMPNNADAIKDLEEKYVEVKAIEPTAKEIDADAGVAADSVEIVGAAFNVAEGSTKATLEIKKSAATAESAKNMQFYSSAKFLDIDLKGVAKDSNGKLSTPVVITMPVPEGINIDKVVVLHYANGINEYPSYPAVVKKDGKISFAADSFSTFAFAEAKGSSSVSDDSSSDDDDDDSSSSSGGGSSFTVDVENQIKGAANGATVKITGINTLSNGMMKALLARKDVTLVLEYTYENKNYTVVIPAGAAVDNDIPWYGPLYLAGHYGNSGNLAAAGSGSVYSVKSGDTMSKIAKVNHMTLAQLAAKNPQIKNINLIRVGQKINL